MLDETLHIKKLHTNNQDLSKLKELKDKEINLTHDNTTSQDLHHLLENLRSQPSSVIKIADKNDKNLVKIFALVVCSEYLGGAWKNVDIKDFQIERLSGGLTNYLYRCWIESDKFKQVDQEPSSILLRLYGENNTKNPTVLLKDVVVSAIMSDYQLGPKLYGIFPIGRLEELINAKSMDQNDMYIPELSREIAQVMGKFHTLEMPFIKEPHWLFDTTAKYIKQVHDVKFTEEKDIKQFEKLCSYNLDSEFKQLKQVLCSINSPVVFCHNDINVGNILKLTNKLMVIDYEYGSYNYRGFDLGNHFCEWMFNNNYDQHPYFQYNYEFYPSREQQLNFVQAYIKQFKKSIQMSRNNSLDEENDSSNNNNDSNNNGISSNKNNVYFESKNLDEEHLIKEANYFALASHLFWANWAICQASVCKIQFEYLDYAMARCDAYFKQKALLFPNGFGNHK